MRSFRDTLATAPLMIADGGIETRLIYEFKLSLPEFASFLPLLRGNERGSLEMIYRGYLQVAADYDLPIQIGTPTWRAHPDCLNRLGFGAPSDLERVNRAAFDLLSDLRREMRMEDRAFIAGVVGPRHDGYDPSSAPERAISHRYHQAQTQVLARCGVDLLYAPTFASAEELLGVAAAMAATGLPYVLAPIIDEAGRLLDGTSLAAAIGRIDDDVAPPPVHYLIGCVHPSRLRAAEKVAAAQLAPLRHRIAGLKANASTLPPEELDKLDHLEEGQPDRFAAEMAGLRREFGFKILGGCCGTGDRHIRAMARRLVKQTAPS